MTKPAHEGRPWNVWVGGVLMSLMWLALYAQGAALLVSVAWWAATGLWLVPLAAFGRTSLLAAVCLALALAVELRFGRPGDRL